MMGDNSSEHKDEFDVENHINDTSTSDSNPVPLRNKYEEPWSDRTEVLLKRWHAQINKLAELHDISGYSIKNRYIYITAPTILIPFIMTFIGQAIPTNSQEEEKILNIVNGAMFMLTSSLSGLSALFGYGQRYEKHFSFSARYYDLSGRIESVMSSKRKYRIPVDVFITEIKCTLDSLNENSPIIPMRILKNY